MSHFHRLHAVDELLDPNDLGSVIREPDDHDTFVVPFFTCWLECSLHSRMNHHYPSFYVLDHAARYHAKALEDLEYPLGMSRKFLPVA